MLFDVFLCAETADVDFLEKRAILHYQYLHVSFTALSSFR